MATYALIHGAGDSWYWHRVVPELRSRGHEVVAPDLPSDDSADLSDYADTVVRAIGSRRDVVVVAQSLGGFTGPLVCDRVPVDLLVLVAAMVPAPGERVADWWGNTGAEEARRAEDARAGRATEEFDSLVSFFHDVPAEVTAEGMSRKQRNEPETAWNDPWPLGRGRTSRRASYCAATTGSSRPRSCAGSYASGWASCRTRSTAATCRHWRTRGLSPTGWRATEPSSADPCHGFDACRGRTSRWPVMSRRALRPGAVAL